MDIENDARTAHMINTTLPTGLMSSTSFKLNNAAIITAKTPINVPTNESNVNINLNRILHMLTPPRFYTIQHQAGHTRTIS